MTENHPEKKEKKRTKPLMKSGLVLLGVGVLGGSYVRIRRQMVEKDMRKFTLQQLELYLHEVMNQAGKDEVKWSFDNVKIDFLTPPLSEFLVRVTYDLTFMDAMERQYTTEQWVVKIKEVKRGQYEVMAQDGALIDEVGTQEWL